jgi:enamine deaminase RidA (YjgF/YER057c/UK114 family)
MFRGQDQLRILQPPGRRAAPLALPHREVREPFNAATVRAVCSRCNSGWMSTVETQARPVLSKLIRGQKTELAATDTEAVATWAVKTAMMVHLTSVEGIAAFGDVYKTFFNDRRPPSNAVVWVAATGAEDWALRSEMVSALVGTDQDSVTVADPVNTTSVTLGLGRLLLHVLLTARTSVSYPPLDDIHPEAVLRIWPDPAPITLPPPLWLVNAGAWGLSRSLAYWLSER